jgi:hypothetical protein
VTRKKGQSQNTAGFALIPLPPLLIQRLLLRGLMMVKLGRDKGAYQLLMRNVSEQ